MKIFQLRYDENVIEVLHNLHKDYQNTKAFPISSIDSNYDRPVKDSNTYFRNAFGNYYNKLIDKTVFPITPAESEQALEKELLVDSYETYEDLGLIIFIKKENVNLSNPELYQHIIDQVKSNYKKIDISTPFIISGLMDVIKNLKYEYGLRLDLNEFTRIYNIDGIFNEKNLDSHSTYLGINYLSFESDNRDLKITGFPSESGAGEEKRRIYFPKPQSRSGIFRVGRSRMFGTTLDILTVNSDLGSHSDFGRMHLIRK